MRKKQLKKKQYDREPIGYALDYTAFQGEVYHPKEENDEQQNTQIPRQPQSQGMVKEISL